MESGGLDILEILLQSGVIVKFVLLLLVACSILSWAIIFQKKKNFKKIELSNKTFHEFFHKSSNLEEIFEESLRVSDSTMGLMFKCGYGELRKIREQISKAGSDKLDIKSYFQMQGTTALERSLKQGANESSDVLDRRLSTLASIGSISPFIGLFGTVWGIIDSFAGLASGGGSIEAVAPGIAEALVATAVGLAAAIPAVWGYNIFNNRIARFHSEMENFGQDFLNLVERSILLAKDE